MQIVVFLMHRLISYCLKSVSDQSSSDVRKLDFGVSDLGRIWPVWSQKKAGSLKFRIQEVERLFYLCMDNKGTNHMCSVCTADLLL